MRLNNLTTQLATLGDAEPDYKIVDKYLRIARLRYKQLVISIETLLDSADLSVEEITGCLKAAEDDDVPEVGRDGDKLYLTEEQWLERYKQKDSARSHRGGGSDSGAGHGKGWSWPQGHQVRRQIHFEWRKRGQVQAASGLEQGEVPQLWQIWPLGPRLSWESQEGGGPCGPRR
jgi:hypothetical protein